jgi:predicted metal-dependent phosphoesterase TrpH
MPSRGDFHCHSTASDGRLSPDAVLRLAYEQGVRVLALTDHDSTEGIDEARATAATLDGFTLIPGVEFGTDIPGAEVHVLGYYLEPEDTELQSTLARLRESRRGRGFGIVKKLQEMGKNVTWEQVQRIAGEASVGRPHVAQALVESGEVATVKEAFDKYIARNGPAYVEREKMTPSEAVQTIVRLGGVACLAHPCDVTADDGALRTILGELKDAGLTGMECHYKMYDGPTVQRLIAHAKSFDLLPLGGSDYHGIFGNEERLPGQMYSPLPEESINALLALAPAKARS